MWYVGDGKGEDGKGEMGWEWKGFAGDKVGKVR